MVLLMSSLDRPTWAAEASRDLMVAPKAAAETVPMNGKYWALLIGIDDYQSAPKLQTAVKDVVGVRDVLVERYGFSLDNMTMLINAQATRTNVEEKLYKLGQLAKADDSVFIYYAGHGQYDEEGRLGWWVPVDGMPKNPGTFITNASIRDYIDGMRARHVYLVADSCFSGTLFGRARAMPPINEQFYARLYAHQSRWGLTSGGMEPVADGGKGGHSIFAYHFITMLKENLDPYLIPSQIFDRIAPLIANNASQTPRSEPIKNAGDEGGQFVFRLVSTAPVKKGPSAASSQAERDLKILMAQEQQIEQEQMSAEEDRQLQAIQQQIEQKKKQIAEKKKAIEEARARPYTPAIPPPANEIAGKDGAPMVLIPAGEFSMGTTEEELQQLIADCQQSRKKDEATCRAIFQSEVPRHRVSLRAFYMDKFEVTNTRFGEFVKAASYRTTAEREGWAWSLPDKDGLPRKIDGATWRNPEGKGIGPADNRTDHPVAVMSWEDADAYCRWAGRRLPTEAEWEYAARAGTQTAYWWGDGLPATRRVANLADASGKRVFPGLAVASTYDDGHARTAPVGSFEANPWGLHDVIGNVWEWTADWYNPAYYQNSPNQNPSGPAAGQYKVLRGGSWRNLPALARAAYRGAHAPGERSAIIGFRCAQDVK
jgi:formylglycine-generating enzyme required for sulfatase activity